MIYPLKNAPDGNILLNLGCGNHYHLAWNNVDFGKRGNEVLGANLLKGIPFADNSVDVVYHSHVLEHFWDTDGLSFMKECNRVLKPNGIIRVAVPDLEQIVRVYLTNLEAGLKAQPLANEKHKWSLLELFDQVVRSEKGGQMGRSADLAKQEMRAYIIERHGYEIKERWETNTASQRTTFKNDKDLGRFIGKMKRQILVSLIGLMGGSDMKSAFKSGLFKTSGELHLQMYDRLLLGNLMTNIGFADVKQVAADQSQIPNWNSYQLDMIGDEIRKPDSLFMEAVKPKRN